MDFASAFPAPFTFSVAGQDIGFAVLTSSEFASYAETMKAEEWKRAQKNPGFKPLDDIQRYRVFEEIDNLPRSITTLCTAARTDDGCRFYVGKSLTKYGYPQEQTKAILDEMSPMDLLQVCLWVTRINKLPKDYTPAKPFGTPLGGGGETGPVSQPPTVA